MPSDDGVEDPGLKEVAENVRKRVTAVLEDFRAGDMTEIKNKIERGEFGAAAVIAKNALLAGRVEPSELCNALKAIELDGLASDAKRDVLDVIVGTATVTYDFAGVLDQVSELQKLIEDPKKLRNLSVIKARGLLQQGKLEAASVINERLLGDSQCEPEFRAWALQGLAEARKGSPEASGLHERAGDAFLEIKQRTQAVNNYLIAARALRHQDPDRAISLVDRALPLFNEKDEVEAEELASLMHSRTELLRSMGRFSDAMESAQRALKLRESLSDTGESLAASGESRRR